MEVAVAMADATALLRDHASLIFPLQIKNSDISFRILFDKEYYSIIKSAKTYTLLER
jgi:hypothetical protein